MLRELRFRLAEGDAAWDTAPVSRPEKAAMDAFAWLTTHPAAFRAALSAASRLQGLAVSSRDSIHRLPGPLSGWTQSRNLRKISRQPFRSRWKQMKRPDMGGTGS
jgi:L-lactate dehydrogenase complex protein LldF